MTSIYIRQLQAEIRQQEQRQHVEQAAKAEAARLTNTTRLTPLVDRLRSFIESLPLSEKCKPQSLEFFRRALRGRQGCSAQAGETGEALRALGFVRRRGWSDVAGGFTAVWFPPLDERK